MNLQSTVKDLRLHLAVGLLGPGIVGWFVALAVVLQSYDSTGIKIAQVFSLPPALAVGLACDGNWVPLLISVVGTIIGAIGLLAVYRPETFSTVTGGIKSAIKQENAAGNPVIGPTIQQPKGGRFGIIKMGVGAVLAVTGILLTIWSYFRRPITDMGDAFNRGMALEAGGGFVLSEFGFYLLIGIGCLSILAGIALALLGLRRS